MQRHCTLTFVVLLVISLMTSAQSVPIDEHRSKVSLRDSGYEVGLVLSASREIRQATVKLEILDPNGAAIATNSLSVSLHSGSNKVKTTIPLTQRPKKSQELMWYRLRCSIEANGEELGRDILPLLDSVQDFALHVSAPYSVPPGKKFFVRVHTNNPVVSKPAGGVTIKVAVEAADKSSTIVAATGTTASNGYTVIPLTLPENVQVHDLVLSVKARRGAIKRTAENELKLGAPTQILVQTDKPLYQPGQTLHVRALVFGDEHRALNHKRIYLQIEDEDGTVVFRDERYSSRFGVVSADWNIPDRLKLGQYGISAKTYPGQYNDDDDSDDDGDNAVTSAMDRRVVRISRYELPTFVVNAKPDRTYYLPDQKASVEVNAAYLFGKPVPKATVRVSRLEERKWNFAKQKWEVDEGDPVTGVSDEQGVFNAALDLTDEFSDFDDGYYRKFRDITYTAYVTDPTSGRTEERRFDVRVTRYPIHVYFVGADASKKGLPDEFFLSTSYADGSAAECDVEVRTVDSTGERLVASAHTSHYGVARVRNAKVIRGDGNQIPLILVAHDRKGATGVTKWNVWQYESEHYLTVVPTKTILAVGDPIQAELRSDLEGSVIVELVNESRILRSVTVRIKNHHAFVSFPYSPDFKGQVGIVALNLTENRWSTAQASKSVIYPENRELKIALKLDHNEYRPGQTAAATVEVKTAVGASIPSVIGAVIFDKGVEERARIDEDLHEPFGFGGYGGWWYRGAKLANLTREDLDRVDTSEPVSDDLDVAADFLLNANGSGTGLFYAPTFGDDDDREDPADVYKSETLKTLAPLTRAIDDEIVKADSLPRNSDELKALLERNHLNWADFKDPWGVQFIPKFTLNYLTYDLEIVSPGPDKVTNTDDDFAVEHFTLNFYQGTERKITQAMREFHRKTGGYVRDMAALNEALALIGVSLSDVLDPWGHAYVFEFGIRGAQYTVTAKTLGVNGKPGGEYTAGISSIDYFEEPRAEITRLLNPKVQAAGKTPESGEEFKKLLLPDFRVDELRDPYGHPYVVRVSAVASYTDKTVATNQQVRTEPVTIWNRVINIRSMGADGVPDTNDDFDVATFATTITQMDMTGKESKPSISLMFTGETGGITGSVIDMTGAVVSNVKVTATNVNTHSTYEATTDSQGKYLILNIPPGIYDVVVNASGFQAAYSRGVVVRAQEAVEINASLRVGSANETVTVEAVASMPLQSSMASVSTVREASTALAQQATVTPRLREYFPETLLWQPSVETDANGRARINWKFADNLTTWKLSLIASTADGRLATLDKEVKSFQPFFVEHDPPKTLTVGDRISLPVVIRNYTEKAQRVKVEMPSGDWFRSNSAAAQEASLAAGGNARLIFPFEATSTTAGGKQRVIATGASVADAIERPVAVHPDGAELTRTDGSIISGTSTLEFNIPAEAIPGSLHADLKIYPDLLAQVTESLEGMLERPYGCGEQTISSTYPSVLLLKFEKQSKRSLGPLHDRALRYANLGYTRLLSYVDESGGFTYWGRGDPDVALTAYAIRFLTDASEFVPVDPTLIDSARKWLLNRQEKDGSWASESWYQHSPVQDAILTAYVAQGLALTQNTSPKAKDPKTESSEPTKLRRALDYLATATKNYSDPYLLASYGLAEVYSGGVTSADTAVAQLRASAENERAGTYWELHANTPFYGWGHAGRVETTALAVQLLDRAGHAEDQQFVARGLEFLIEQKDRYGAWYSTQTTVNVIQTLLLLASRETPPSQSPLKILVNGSAQPLPSNTEQALSPQFLDISKFSHAGKNTIEISGGNGKLTSAQVVADYYVRWDSSLAVPRTGPLKLSVTCDQTHLQVGEKATCKVKVERVGSAGHGMMIAEIGIPPGVDLDREALQKDVSDGGWELSSFDVLPDRVIAYVWPRAGGTQFSLTFKPRMAIDAVAAPHSLYDYYNPDASVTVAPDRFLVVEPAPVAQR